MQAPLLQQLAYQELAAVAGAGPAAARRRADAWADDSGGAWCTIAQGCLAQVTADGLPGRRCVTGICMNDPSRSRSLTQATAHGLLSAVPHCYVALIGCFTAHTVACPQCRAPSCNALKEDAEGDGAHVIVDRCKSQNAIGETPRRPSDMYFRVASKLRSGHSHGHHALATPQ